MTKLDVRVLAATNRDVDGMLAQGTFRADLYHRLAVMVARIPPLRLRRDDMPLLAAHFLHTLRYLHGIPAPVVRNYISTSLGVLQTYAWPGNVRELRNVVERAAILADPASIEADALTRLNAVRKTLSIGGGLGRLPDAARRRAVRARVPHGSPPDLRSQHPVGRRSCGAAPEEHRAAAPKIRSTRQGPLTSREVMPSQSSSFKRVTICRGGPRWVRHLVSHAAS